ncbi:MAG: glycosyltransferase family 2 protein [Planctomycetes bacterium]|nr:glycosyltransferase family 2 protein [Planctomycetota bacterium]
MKIDTLIAGSTREKRLDKSPFSLSIVIPAFNEGAGITQTVEVISRIVENCTKVYELIVVDDGSRDTTFEEIRILARHDEHVKGIRFSRNFGKESAILAGLRVAEGDAIITIDADLQHPPSIIPKMVKEWQDGVKVVHAVKSDRSNDSTIARLRAKLFNGLLELLGGVKINNSSDYKLLDRIAVDVLVKELPERGRFYRGLSDWIGFKQTSVQFTVASRNAGEGKWSLFSLIGLAITAIVSFTSAPLRIVTVLGIVTLIFGFLVATEALWSWFMGQAVSGFATIIITLLILGSFIMISLGVMGEYIAKIYDEIKARPKYLVESTAGIEAEETTGHL